MRPNTIAFDPLYISHILTGEKTSAVKLWPVLKVNSNETVELIDSNQRKPFALAKVSLIETKKFDEFTDEDRSTSMHHEDFENFKKIMESFYGQPITPETEFRIVHFRIIDDGQDRAIAEQIKAMQKEKKKDKDKKEKE